MAKERTKKEDSLTALQDRYDNWGNEATVNDTYETYKYMKNSVYELENNIKQMDEATAELIREDLRVAGIDLTDRDGNDICFHSLRNSYISFLANSQTPAKVVQKLVRHSDPRLTFNTYVRTFEEAEQKALNFLPDFGNFVLVTCLDSKRKKQEISIDNYRHNNSQDTRKNAFSAENQIAPRGFEPLLPG